MGNSCLSVQLDGQSEKTKIKICSSHSPHLILLITKLKLGSVPKKSWKNVKCAKLAKSNAESMAELHELQGTAMQTALVLCYSNKLFGLGALNNTDKTFQAMDFFFLLNKVQNASNKFSRHHIFNCPALLRKYRENVWYETLLHVICTLILIFSQVWWLLQFYQAVIFNGGIQCCWKKYAHLASRNS